MTPLWTHHQVRMVTEVTGQAMRVVSASTLETFERIPRRLQNDTPAVSARPREHSAWQRQRSTLTDTPERNLVR